MLNDFSYVPGVTISGTIPGAQLANHTGRSAKITIAGASAAAGTVRLSAGNRASGQLGATKFDVRLASEASVAGPAGGGDPARLAREPGLAHTP